VITRLPKDKIVNASTDVSFRCSARTDLRELASLRITWKRDGREINLSEEPRLYFDLRDNTLKVIAAQPEDSGDYTCVAENGIDQDEATALLLVRDRPDPPKNVHLTLCYNSYTQIAWEASNDNNEPIIEYIVYYNTSFDYPGSFKEDQRVSKETLLANKNELSPWTTTPFMFVQGTSLV
jgi:receptor-type tyrosine-protein phosphatase zeta